MIPPWLDNLIAAAFLAGSVALCALDVRVWAPRRADRRTRCGVCRYDLTGLARCPECGQ